MIDIAKPAETIAKMIRINKEILANPEQYSSLRVQAAMEYLEQHGEAHEGVSGSD